MCCGQINGEILLIPPKDSQCLNYVLKEEEEKLTLLNIVHHFPVIPSHGAPLHITLTCSEEMLTQFGRGGIICHSPFC